jgi:tetratricopeptide (TPR) repeat protein
MMAAIVGLRSGVPNALSLTRIELAHQSADLLVAQRLSKAFPDNPGLALHLAAYATLTAGLPREHALAVLHAEAQANHLGTIQNPSAFLDRLSSWLPAKSPDQILGPIEPDIVGEAFLLGNPIPRLVNPEQTILRSIEKRTDQTIQFLIRTTQDFCLAEEGARLEPLEWLEALIAKGDADDFGLLFQIEEALPGSSVVLRAHALSIRQKLVERFQYYASRQLDDTGDLSVDLLSAIAVHLLKLSNSQSQVGERERALDSAEEALTIYRKLVQRDRETFLPNLSILLNNLAILQGAMGKREQALITGNEAVTIGRELVRRDRVTFLANLAMTVTNLCSLQSASGQRQQARATGEEAVALKRELVERDRDTFLPGFALALNNLANLESAAGEHEEALTTAYEALNIYRELVQVNRDAFLTDLAMTLHNAANLHSEVGDHERALAIANEAVKLRRELVQHQPEVFLPDLAMSLNNLAVMHSKLRNHQHALITSQEASTIYEGLVKRNPGAFLPEFAASLSVLASGLSDVGEHAKALNTARDATMIYRALVTENREAFLPQLALSLNNLANRHTQMEEHELALDIAVESVTLRRELVESNRKAFLPGLARSVNNLANRQRDLGDHQHALSTAQEAVDLYSELLRNRNAVRPDLAHAHGTLGSIQMDNELYADARQSFADAIRVLMPYIEDHPFAPDIQMAVILCRNYLVSCEKGSLPPDMQLLDDIAPVLGPYLDQNEPGESS